MYAIVDLNPDATRMVVWGLGATPSEARSDAAEREGYRETDRGRVVEVDVACAEAIRRGEVSADDLLARAAHSIVDPPAERIEPARENNPDRKNLRREAESFLSKNPHIYAMFVRFARERAQTRRAFGVKLLAERVRWECGLMNLDGDDYLLNNNHVAYIARKLVSDHPDLMDMIRFRKTRY